MELIRHHTESLSAVDAAWLRMDSPLSPMVITALIEFEREVPRDVLARIVAERLLPRRRFRQRIETATFALRPGWVEDEHFDLRSHLHHVALPAPGGRAALAEFLSDAMSTPLDPTKPLWQMWLIDRLGRLGRLGDHGGVRSSLVVRLHHCIGDGVSLVRLLLELADGPPAVTPREVGLVREPPHAHLDRVRLLADEAKATVHLLRLPPDPVTPLAGPLGVRKRAAWSDPIPLADVEAAAHAHGCTVNDLLLAATTGALRSHLLREGALAPGIETRALVPVNLRRTGTAAAELGNRFGMIYVPLPLGVADPLERLREVKRRVDEIKASSEAAVSLGVLGAMGLFTAGVERLGVDLFSRKATVLATNVPGPATPVAIGGVPVQRLLVWAPVSGRVAVGFSFLTYAGTLTVGLGADEGRLRDVEGVVRDVQREIEGLSR